MSRRRRRQNILLALSTVGVGLAVAYVLWWPTR